MVLQIMPQRWKYLWNIPKLVLQKTMVHKSALYCLLLAADFVTCWNFKIFNNQTLCNKIFSTISRNFNILNKQTLWSAARWIPDDPPSRMFSFHVSLYLSLFSLHVGLTFKDTHLFSFYKVDKFLHVSSCYIDLWFCVSLKFNICD